MARSKRPSGGWVRRFGFAVTSGAIVIPAAIACNSLVGLDDFERAECAGRKCVGEGGLPDRPDVPDVEQPDAAVEAGPGEPPTSWPKWPMPNYDAGGVPNPPVFQDIDANVARDTTTNLTWRRKPVTGTLETWAAANDACAGLAPAGQWRLPTRIELVTLLDYSHDAPFRMATINGLLGGSVWTSSAVKPFTGAESQAYWVVNFDTGAVETKAQTAGAIALCTRNQ